MKNKRILLLALSLFFVLNLTIFSFQQQEDKPPTEKAQVEQKEKEAVPQVKEPPPAGLQKQDEVDVKEIIQATQKSLDRSISILNIVVTLLGVLVALAALIVAIGAALGFFELRRWKDLRIKAESDAKYIKDTRKEIEKDMDKYGYLFKDIKLPELFKKPNEDLKAVFPEYDLKFSVLELLGYKFEAEDYFNRSYGYFNNDEYIKALASINKAIDIEPKDGDFWYLKGLILNMLEFYDQALVSFDKAIELNTDDASAHYDKACTLAILGKQKMSLESLKRAIELNKELKKDARENEEFKDLWDDPEFKKITSE